MGPRLARKDWRSSESKPAKALEDRTAAAAASPSAATKLGPFPSDVSKQAAMDSASTTTTTALADADAASRSAADFHDGIYGKAFGLMPTSTLATAAAATRQRAAAGGGHELGREERSGAEERITVNTNRKHRRRDSAIGSNLLAQLVNHVILLTILLILQHNHQQPAAVEALKLPSFLSSWMPHQQQQQQQQSAQQQTQQAAAGIGQKQHQQHDDLVGEHSSNLLTFAESLARPATAANAASASATSSTLSQRPRALSSAGSSLKRPFQSMLAGSTGVGKHPAGHLFSSLPKSLFGRILSSSSGHGNSQAAVLKQQHLQSLMASKYQMAKPNTVLWPFVQQPKQQRQPHFSPNLHPMGGQMSPGGYKQQAEETQYQGGSQMAQLANGGQLIATLLHRPADHPITSFRPAPANNDNVAGKQLLSDVEQEQRGFGSVDPTKKHALGYNEQDEDFIILNAQQVPELQGTPSKSSHEEYREVPAIVISDPDLVESGPPASDSQPQQQQPQQPQTDALNDYTSSNSSQVANSADQKNVSLETGSQEARDLFKLNASATHQQNQLNRTTQSRDGGNRTEQADVTNIDGLASTQLGDLSITGGNRSASLGNSVGSAVDVDNGAATRLVSETKLGETSSSFQSAPNATGQSESTSQQQAGVEASEINRQESAAKAVVVPSVVEPQLVEMSQVSPQLQMQLQSNQQQQQQQQESMESFILGPYKGLSLGDELIPQTQMEFMEPPVQQAHQPQQQSFVINHNTYQPPRTHAQAGRHSSGAHLIGSASSLIQQARQLIQMPFTHLPQNAHFHQLAHRPTMQQSVFSYVPTMDNYRALASRTRPVEHQQQQPKLLNAHQQAPAVHHHHHWQPNYPTSNSFMSTNRAPAINNFNKLPYFLAGPEQTSLAMASSLQLQQQPHRAHFSSNSQTAHFYRPAGYLTNSIVHHGPAVSQQYAQQQAPRQAFPQNFGNQQPQPAYQQPRVPQQAPSFQQQIQQDSTQIHLNDNTPFNATDFDGERLHKSGLYQIEPPKLVNERNKLSPGDELNQEMLQQQRVEVSQETANELDDDSNGDKDEDDEDDNPQQQHQQQQQQQQHQQQQQASAPIPAEPIAMEVRESSTTANRSSGEPLGANQILQVGASFGVSDINKTLTLNDGLARKGQVFSEPIRQQATGGPEFIPGQPFSAPVGGYLNTQVYTMPYAMASAPTRAGNGFPSQTPPRYLRPDIVRVPSQVYNMHSDLTGWQTAGQQLPITFITTSAMSPSTENRGHELQISSQGAAPLDQRLANHFHAAQTRNTGNFGQSFEGEQARTNELPAVNFGFEQAKQGNQQYFHYQPAITPQAAQSHMSQNEFQFAVRHEPTAAFDQQQPSSERPADYSSTMATPNFGASSNEQLQAGPTSATQGDREKTSEASSTASPGVILVDSSQEVETEAQKGSQRAASDSSSGAQADQQEQKSQQAERGNEATNSERRDPIGKQQQQLARSPSSFCSGRPAGLYADTEQRCKAYYQCAPTGHQMFRCNNQTQFNQKTQNCDWWYNVDCGGRTGSPDDFEQATAASGPRSQVASVEATETPAMTTSTAAVASITTTTAGAASAATVAGQEQQQQQQQRQDELKLFVEFPTSSTASYVHTGTAIQQNSSSSFEQQQQQSMIVSDAVGGGAGQSDSSQQQFPAEAVVDGNSASKAQEVTDAQQQTSAKAAPSSNYNSLIEVVASTSDSQPRVGAMPAEETTTTTTTTAGLSSRSVASSGVAIRAESSNAQPGHGESSETSRSNQSAGSQRKKQISQADEEAKTRRLVQSEFGGSSKNARAVSSPRLQDISRLQLAVGELSSLEGDQLEQQEHHQSVRMGSSSQLEAAGDNQQAPEERAAVLATTALSTRGQSATGISGQSELQERQQNLVGPTRRRGSAPEAESDEAKSPTTTGKLRAQEARGTKLERRFGARLTPGERSKGASSSSA